jgi:PAS domain-containing protein
LPALIKNGCFTTATGDIFWCNDAYLKLTGFSKEDVMGITPIVAGKCEGTTEAELDEMRVPFINGQAFDLSIFIAEKMVLIFLVKVRDSLFSTKTEKFPNTLL